jgi:hypothetical protein
MINELDLEDKIAVVEEKLNASLGEVQSLQGKVESLKTDSQPHFVRPASGAFTEGNFIKFFVMMPYAEDYGRLEKAIRNILEDDPYWFELHLARDRTLEPEIVANIRHHVSAADGYIAEISELNPNVMMELGWLFFEPTLRSRFHPELGRPPLIMLWSESEANGKRPPANLEGSLRVDRPGLGSGGLESALRREFDRVESLQKLVARRVEKFLSIHSLEKREFSSAQAKRINGRFKSVEKLLSSDFSEVKDRSERGLFESARYKLAEG